MEMKHLYFKERPETLWREKDRGFFKGKQVQWRESEFYEGMTGIVVDEDFKVVEKYFEHSLDELEPDAFFINDETYSEMEKARDLLCSLCYEVKCKDCQIVKLMAEAKAARDRSKEKQESYKAEPSFRKQLTLSDWEKMIHQVHWHDGDVTILDIKRGCRKDDPSFCLSLTVKDEDDKEIEFLLVPTEHGIFPSAAKR